MDPEDAHDTGHAALRNLPSVDHLLKQPAVASLLDEQPRGELVAAIRAVLDDQRDALRAGREVRTDVATLALQIRQKLYRRSQPHLRRVVNATGIVLHTGLGRAPLAQEAVEAIAEVAGGYSNLEINLATGQRGDRHDHVRELLRELTGAEDGLVVNNNAAATYLALHTLAAEREVVVSRGQLVEIGGSYRMPDIMAAARCRMIEVGTTNRTRISDYERAVTSQTAALLRVHTSNFRVLGFVASPTLEELVALGRQYKLPVIDDLGSGLLDERLPQARQSAAARAEPGATEQADLPVGPVISTPTAPAAPAWWDEPSVRQSVAAGADLTLFSGDKLLGGPQAGVVVGRADLIAQLRRNPLMRTFRPDKLTLTGLEATLRLYRDPESLGRRLPVYRMLTCDAEELAAAALALSQRIAQFLPAARVECLESESLAGGGSLPLRTFKTWVVCVRLPALSSASVADALRDRAVPIIGRVQNDALVFDCRTLLDDDAEQIATALAEVVRDQAGV